MSTGKRTALPPIPLPPQIPAPQRHYPSAAHEQRGPEKFAAIVDVPREYASVMDPEYPNVSHAGRHHEQQGQGDVMIELEEIPVAFGESAVSEVGNDPDHKSSESSELSSAPSVPHYNISFEYKKAFREHKGAKTVKPCQKYLKPVYSFFLVCTYNVLVVVLGLCLIIVWALINAIVAFIQTWCISPLTRVSLVLVRGLLPIVLEPLGMLIKMYTAARGGGVAGLVGNLGGA